MLPTRLAVIKTLSEPLHASYTLCGSQNTLSEPLHASYTLCGSQHGFLCTEYVPPFHRFVLVIGFILPSHLYITANASQQCD